MTKTIIIADDHPFITEGMRAAIEALPDFEVTAIAENGIEAIALIKTNKPDCALLDLSMPGANGLEVFLEAKRWSPETRFAIITGGSAGVLFRQLEEAGIDGLFVKSEPPEEISAAITRIMEGHKVISTAARGVMAESESRSKLSKRELEVLQYLARGLNNRQIAEALGVSPKTIDTHRTNLLLKMNVNTTAALLVKAMKNGLIDA